MARLVTSPKRRRSAQLEKSLDTEPPLAVQHGDSCAHDRAGLGFIRFSHDAAVSDRSLDAASGAASSASD